MEIARNVNDQCYNDAQKVLNEKCPISQKIIDDFNESKNLVDNLDNENILGMARNLVFQLLNTLPEFEVNNTNFGDRRTHDFPDRNIIAYRAIISTLFANTAMYIFKLLEHKFYKDFGRHVGFGYIGSYPYHISLTDINAYLNDIVNSSNIGAIAGTIVYSEIVSCLMSNMNHYKNDKYNDFTLDQTTMNKLRDYVVLLDGILNCLGYFAYECRPLMFNNITVKIPKVYYREDDELYY